MLKYTYSLFAKSTRCAVSSIEFANYKWHNVSAGVLQVTKYTKFLYATDLLFEIPTLYRTARRAISGKARMISSLRCVLCASRITGYTMRVISACREVGLIERRCPWTRKVVKLVFCMRIVGLFVALHDIKGPLDRADFALKVFDCAVTGLSLFTKESAFVYAAQIVDSLSGLILIELTHQLGKESS